MPQYSLNVVKTHFADEDACQWDCLDDHVYSAVAGLRSLLFLQIFCILWLTYLNRHFAFFHHSRLYLADLQEFKLVERILGSLGLLNYALEFWRSAFLTYPIQRKQFLIFVETGATLFPAVINGSIRIRDLSFTRYPLHKSLSMYADFCSFILFEHLGNEISLVILFEWIVGFRAEDLLLLLYFWFHLRRCNLWFLFNYSLFLHLYWRFLLLCIFVPLFQKAKHSLYFLFLF